MAPYTCVDMGNKSETVFWQTLRPLQPQNSPKYDLRFEISDPNYLLIHVHIAYMVWALLAASEATTASKQPRRSGLTSYFKSVASITY